MKHFNSGCRPEAVVDILPPEADSTVQSMAAELQLVLGMVLPSAPLEPPRIFFGPKTSTPHAGLVDKHKLSMKNMAREIYLFFLIYIHIIYDLYMVPKGKLT